VGIFWNDIRKSQAIDSSFPTRYFCTVFDLSLLSVFATLRIPHFGFACDVFALNGGDGLVRA
jgi:hypothetical protein